MPTPDQAAHDELARLKQLAQDNNKADKVPQITELENAFGPQAALKITGSYNANYANGAASIFGAGGQVGDWHVANLLTSIKGEVGGKPTAQQTALQTALQDAIKRDPALVDRLEQALTNDPNLASKLQYRYVHNPDGVKAQLAELTKPGANISGIVNGISSQPAPAPAAPAAPAPAAPAAPAGGRGNGPAAAPAQPPASAPAQPPAAQPATAASPAPFNKDTELAKITDPKIKEGVSALYDAMMKNEDIKREFDKIQDQDEKRRMIAHLAEAAKADPNFLKNTTDLVNNKHQLVANALDDFANDTVNTVNKLKIQEVPPAEGPGGPGGRRPDPNNPFSGLMSMISEKMGPMLGRIASLFMNILEGALGFFEKMFGGGTHGVSSNPNNPVLSQAFPGAQMGPDGPLAAPGAGGRPPPSPLVRGPGMGGG